MPALTRLSHTMGLGELAIAIVRRNGVDVDVVRAIDHEIATGVHLDMTAHGWDRDEWPEIFEQAMAADILVLLSPIWLGEKSSVCTKVIDRGAEIERRRLGLQCVQYGRWSVPAPINRMPPARHHCPRRRDQLPHHSDDRGRPSRASVGGRPHASARGRPGGLRQPDAG
jgi:NADPH-dependent FMN reductase